MTIRAGLWAVAAPAAMATTRARTSTKRATIMAEPFSGPAPRPSDDRRVPPRKQEDAPAEDTIDDEAEQAQHQQRHEDVVHQHVEARVPEHLAEAVVGGNQRGGHGGDEGELVIARRIPVRI